MSDLPGVRMVAPPPRSKFQKRVRPGVNPARSFVPHYDGPWKFNVDAFEEAITVSVPNIPHEADDQWFRDEKSAAKHRAMQRGLGVVCSHVWLQANGLTVQQRLSLTHEITSPAWESNPEKGEAVLREKAKESRQPELHDLYHFAADACAVAI